MKKYFILILILLLFSGGILYFQWEDYSSSEEYNEVLAKASINVEHKAGVLQVKQIISDLPSGNYKIKIPEKIKEMTCKANEGKTCSIKNNQVEVVNHTLTFTYTLPISEKRIKSFLLEDWLIQLENVQIRSPIIQLSEYSWREGNWVGNVKKAEKREMDLIDYYYLEGIEEDVVLYWQKLPLIRKASKQGLAVFAENPGNDIEEISYKPLSDKNLSLIFSSVHKEWKGERLWIMPAGHYNAAEKLFAQMDIENTFTFKAGEEWLSEVIVAVLLNSPPADSKAKKMYKELSQSLTKKQWGEWQEKLRTFDQVKLESEDLDEMLGELAEAEVRFFTQNANKSQPFSQLIIYNTQNFFLNDKNMGDIHALQLNDRWLIDVISVLEALQYQVQVTEKLELEASKGDIHYRFYPDKRYFDLNKQRYGIDGSPIVLKNKMYMIELPYIELLFNAEAKQNKNAIYIEKK